MIRRPASAVASAALVIAIALAALVATGCAVAEVRTAEGLVISVEGDSPASVERFTLRTNDGTLLEFVIEGAIDFGHGGFPGSHLREHQALGEPVRVTYRVAGSGAEQRLVVVRLEDEG